MNYMNNNFLEIQDVTFAASKKNKVNNVTFSVEKEGEIICLLWHSGIGKTTILRSIAGLEKIQSGKIILKDKIVSSSTFHMEPEKRNIALSFQENCLFPHYNVIDNIKFGADRNKNKKFNFSVYDFINLLRLEEIQQKYPHEISAGEAQRVSLARSLMSKPDLLLLDEPFSNIDQSLKEELQLKIKKILHDVNITTIIVTHDSYEAFYMGNKCGIILDQSLKQFDIPYNIYHYPNSLEVVDWKFIGTNFIYTLKTMHNQLIPVFVHSHHEHQHKIKDKFGIKRPIYIDHLVCF